MGMPSLTTAQAAQSVMTQHLNKITVQHLPKDQHALLRKFYRSHHSPMRITQQAQAWVVRAPEIIAGVCLSPTDQGYWLTSLFTAPQHRNNGTASFLIQHIQSAYPEKSIWLFCHPELSNFYSRLGFNQTDALPDALNSRLKRYQQHKLLIAMLYTS